MADDDTPAEVIEEGAHQVEETSPPPEPPAKDDAPAWAQEIITKVNSLEEQVRNMTPAPPPVDEVIENDDKPVSLPWTHRSIGGSHGHHDED